MKMLSKYRSIVFRARSLVRRPGFLRRPKRQVLSVVLIAVSLVAVLVLTALVQRQQSLRTGASVPTATLYIEPSSTNMPPNSNFEVWVDAKAEFSYISFTLKFDRNSIRLQSAPVLEDSRFRQVAVSSVEEANSSGVINVIAGLDPSSKVKGVSGIMPILGISMEPATNETDRSTNISFDITTTQIITPSLLAFTVSYRNANITLNPTQSSPTPGPAGASCEAMCQSAGFSGAACVQNVNLCNRRPGTNVTEGDQYCSGGRDKTCCCF